MSKRRFKITYEESEIILLALNILSDQLKEQDFQNSVFWKSTNTKVTQMIKKIEGYTWETGE